MVFVDGEAEDKLKIQHQLKLILNYPIGQFTFPFIVNKCHQIQERFLTLILLWDEMTQK